MYNTHFNMWELIKGKIHVSKNIVSIYYYTFLLQISYDEEAMHLGKI